MKRLFALLLVPAFQQIVPIGGHGAAPVGLHLWAMTSGLQPFHADYFLAALVPVACLAAACLVPAEKVRNALYLAGLAMLILEAGWLMSVSERAWLTLATALTFVGLALWSLTEWFLWPRVGEAPPPRRRAAAALLGLMGVELALGMAFFLWEMSAEREGGPPLKLVLLPVVWALGLVLSAGAIWKGWVAGFVLGFVLSSLQTGNTVVRAVKSGEMLGGRSGLMEVLLTLFQSGAGVLMGTLACVLLVLEYAGRRRSSPPRVT